VSEFKGIRIRFEYQILKAGTVLAEGMTHHAFMDKDGRPRKVPKEVRERIDSASRI